MSVQIPNLNQPSLRHQRATRDYLPKEPAGRDIVRLVAAAYIEETFKSKDVFGFAVEMLATTRGDAVKVGRRYSFTCKLGGKAGSLKSPGTATHYAALELNNAIAAFAGVQKTRQMLQDKDGRDYEAEVLPEDFNPTESFQSWIDLGESLHELNLVCEINNVMKPGWVPKSNPRLPLIDPATGLQKFFPEKYFNLAQAPE